MALTIVTDGEPWEVPDGFEVGLEQGWKKPAYWTVRAGCCNTKHPEVVSIASAKKIVDFHIQLHSEEKRASGPQTAH